MFSRKITEQYPEQEPKLPANYRGVHRLNRDEAGPGEVRRLLHVRHRLPRPLHRHRRRPRPDRVATDREKYPETFVIDELRCIYCGMCEEACPVDAIELTTLYDLTGLSREEMIFDKEKLLSVFDQTTAAGTDPVRTQAGRLSLASRSTAPVSKHEIRSTKSEQKPLVLAFGFRASSSSLCRGRCHVPAPYTIRDSLVKSCTSTAWLCSRSPRPSLPPGRLAPGGGTRRRWLRPLAATAAWSRR